jgi:hypothetical protein
LIKHQLIASELDVIAAAAAAVVVVVVRMEQSMEHHFYLNYLFHYELYFLYYLDRFVHCVHFCL